MVKINSSRIPLRPPEPQECINPAVYSEKNSRHYWKKRSLRAIRTAGILLLERGSGLRPALLAFDLGDPEGEPFVEAPASVSVSRLTMAD